MGDAKSKMVEMQDSDDQDKFRIHQEIKNYREALTRDQLQMQELIKAIKNNDQEIQEMVNRIQSELAKH